MVLQLVNEAGFSQRKYTGESNARDLKIPRMVIFSPHEHEYCAVNRSEKRLAEHLRSCGVEVKVKRVKGLVGAVWAARQNLTPELAGNVDFSQALSDVMEIKDFVNRVDCAYANLNNGKNTLHVELHASPFAPANPPISECIQSIGRTGVLVFTEKPFVLGEDCATQETMRRIHRSEWIEAANVKKILGFFGITDVLGLLSRTFEKAGKLVPLSHLIREIELPAIRKLLPKKHFMYSVYYMGGQWTTSEKNFTYKTGCCYELQYATNRLVEYTLANEKVAAVGNYLIDYAKKNQVGSF